MILIFGVLLVVAPFLGPAGQEYAYAIAGIASAAGILAGVRTHRPARRPAWLLLAAGMACGAVANVMWGTQLAVGLPGGPRFSVIDVVYFGMYPLLAAGLAILPERRGAGLAEAGIVACTGATLAWVLLYDPYVIDQGRSPTDVGAAAYPVLDILLVAMAVRMMVAQRRLDRTHVLLLGTALLMVVADVPYFLSVTMGGAWSGPVISVVAWLAAFALPAVAALHPAPEPPSDATGDSDTGSWRTAALHGTLVLIGPTATCYALLKDQQEGELNGYDFIVPLSATAIIALLLVLRMTTAQRELHRHATSLAAALHEQELLQRSLQHLAEHDALTGLPNRRMLEQRIGSSTPYSLVLLDLDGFQDVNDRLGHEFGDRLLLALAERLRDAIEPGEILARTGGDEFAVLVPAAASARAGRPMIPADALARADILTQAHALARAETLVKAMRSPVSVGGHTLHVTASIGVRPADGTADPVHLLGDADLALYAAKAAGKDCVIVYETAFRDRQSERIRIVERLRAALGADELAVHYQPIVDLTTSRTVAVEALVRWLPPGETPIGPDAFIPAAEDSGLIIALGEWVLRQACADAASWYHAAGVSLTVNVSPRQLADEWFTAKVRRSLADSGLPAAALTLEITEGVLVGAGHQTAQALAHLETLRGDGIRIAVDDFGTGYSSLAYLRDLPIDTLKIDRSLMPADERDSRQLALVRAVVDLARSLELTTVAEGIETSVQGDLLRGIGCDRGQGYHYARPMPAADLVGLTAPAAMVVALG